MAALAASEEGRKEEAARASAAEAALAGVGVGVALALALAALAALAPAAALAEAPLAPPAAALVILHRFTRQSGRSPGHQASVRACVRRRYLCLEKSWGRSRGPSGTLPRPRPGADVVDEGSGRDEEGGRAAAAAAADDDDGGGAVDGAWGVVVVKALAAPVERTRQPSSPVFWNLRTRSSAHAVAVLAYMDGIMARRPGGWPLNAFSYLRNR